MIIVHPWLVFLVEGSRAVTKIPPPGVIDPSGVQAGLGGTQDTWRRIQHSDITLQHTDITH